MMMMMMGDEVRSFVGVRDGDRKITTNQMNFVRILYLWRIDELREDE